jgi:fructose/tagatose bisphosphate aldolase
MTPVSPKILYNNCYGKYATAAVNVFNMEQVHGLFSAAQESETPIIVQLTPAARNYAHPKMLMAMVQAAAKIYSKTSFCYSFRSWSGRTYRGCYKQPLHFCHDRCVTR